MVDKKKLKKLAAQAGPAGHFVDREYSYQVGRDGKYTATRIQLSFTNDSDGGTVTPDPADERIFLVLFGAGWTDVEWSDALVAARRRLAELPPDAPILPWLKRAIATGESKAPH